METLIFATNNAHKADEIRSVLNKGFEIVTLKESGIIIDIPEPYATLLENANTKSQTIYELTGKSCFGEDTGLEVDALNGEPGVRSARYAGDHANSLDNIRLLLKNLNDVTDRKARFRTVISLNLKGTTHNFEGICPGKIIHEQRGHEGFGYDSIFVPDGSDKTFGEMLMEEKNRYSHRKKATDLLVNFLNKQTNMGRIKLVIPEKVLTTVSIPVRITDLNYGNHVGNDSLVSILHEARVLWLSHHSFSELDVAGTSLIMGDLTVEFVNESFYGDNLVITIAAGEVTGVSFELYYAVHCVRNEKTLVIARAKTGMVCYDYNLKKVTAVPEKLKSILMN